VLLEAVMAAPLSLDLRVRIVRFVEAGHSIRRAAERFQVSPSAAIKLMARVRKTGPPQPGRLGGNRRPLLEPHAELVQQLVEVKPDLTLDELHAELAGRGVSVARATVHRMVRRLGLTLKKSRSRRRSRIGRM
jgi:putative transposase